MSGKNSERAANSERCGFGRQLLARCQRILLPLIMGFVFAGCGSSTQLETSKAVSCWAVLRTACSAEDGARLEEAAKSLDAAHQAGEITENEHKLFVEVVAKAREKNWKEAKTLCIEIHSLEL